MRYQRLKYPDGQISVKVTHLPDLAESQRIDIKERINSYEDLIFIRALVDAIGNEYNLHLTIPCLFGQRSDARFSPHQSHDLKIIAEVINACGFKSVGILDPHSNSSLDLIHNSYKLSSFEYVKQTISALENGSGWGRNLTIISPDAGAYKKVWNYSAETKIPLLAANKHRQLDGSLHTLISGDVKDKECLIIDDLIDGGYTFISLAEQLKSLGAAKVYLYATHGLFSKGVDVMCGPLDRIFCTNSVKDVEHKKVTQFKVI